MHSFPLLIIAKTPRKGHTPFRIFFEEIFPSGNKKQTFCSATPQSSRTGIFSPASIVINNARQRFVQRNEPQHTRWQISLRIKLRPDKQGKVCRYYCKKYSKRLICHLTFVFSADILQAKLVFTDKHNGEKNGSII